MSDEAILDGALRAIGRHGARFTLAHVAKQVGLTPARMVQRFGSKQGLLHAVAKRSGKAGRLTLVEFAASKKPPIQFLLDNIAGWSSQLVDRRQIANYMSVFRYHLDDPVMRRLDVAAYREQRRFLTAVLKRAIEVGQLRKCDPARLSRSIIAVSMGSYFIWAGYERGNPAAGLRREILAVLEPYRLSA